MMGRGAALALAVAALGFGGAARAQSDLDVRTLEHGDWASTVAALQGDVTAEGRTVHVVVEGGGRRAPCGHYLLLLDAYGQRAFANGGCDPTTQATALRLVQRAALFELGDIPRPRIVQIAAFELRQATAEGRAAQPAGAELRCSVGLRPFVLDLLHGTAVRATPERFEVRALGDGADVHVEGDAWTVRSGSMRFAYELVDRHSREVVLRETVAMACSSTPLEPTLTSATHGPPSTRPFPSAPPASGPAPSEDALSSGPPIERVLRPDEPSRYRGRCGGEAGPDHVYTVHVGHPTWVALRVESRFDAILSLRNADGRELDCSIVTGDPDQIRVPRAWAQLASGTYYVVVDAASRELGDGWYRLGMDFARTQ